MAGKPGRSGRPKRAVVSGQGFLTAPRPIELPASIGEGVTGRGLIFLEEARAYDNWTPSTRVLVRQAALLIDRVERLHGKRGEDSAVRLLVTVLTALPFKNAAASAKPESKWKAA